MSTDEIYNARVVDDRLITSGQPTGDQLRAAAAAGIDTVVNLAPHDAGNALPDEAGLVHELGMTYHHLPVVFANPTEDDLAAFEQVMAELPPDSRTLLHCAANFRVSAFYGLYALKHLGWSVEQAEAFRAPIWDGSDYPVWEAFISRMREKLTGRSVTGTVAELRRLDEEATPRDRLILTGYFFSHFFSQPPERLALRRALIAAGFTGVGSDEELTGDEYWHHYSHTIRPADPNVLRAADAEAAAIAQAHGAQYDGWEVVRVEGTGALREPSDADRRDLLAMNEGAGWGAEPG